MPLTSAPNGVGVNKMDVGVMNCLPTSLKSNHTYAVFNQIRDYEKEQVQALEFQIKDIIKDIPYSLTEQLIQDGIGEIFEHAKNHKTIVFVIEIC